MVLTSVAAVPSRPPVTKPDGKIGGVAEPLTARFLRSKGASNPDHSPSPCPDFEQFQAACLEATLKYLRSRVLEKPTEEATLTWLHRENPDQEAAFRVEAVRGGWYLNLLFYRDNENAPCIVSCIEAVEGAWRLSAVITKELSVTNLYLAEPINSTYPAPQPRKAILPFQNLG